LGVSFLIWAVALERNVPSFFMSLFFGIGGVASVKYVVGL
jgi:hypothetical protein